MLKKKKKKVLNYLKSSETTNENSQLKLALVKVPGLECNMLSLTPNRIAVETSLLLLH